MAALNKCCFIGNVGKDPETRYTQDGKAITSFSIAVTDKWTDKTTGEKREKTEWIRIVTFDRLAEVCGEYLSKGRQVYAEGKMQTRSYEKDGTTRYISEVVASTVQMLGKRENSSGNQHPPQGQNSGNPNQGGNQGYQGGGQAPPMDDIPF